MANHLHQEFHAKLLQLGIPAHDVKVFGTLRTNVHVLCVGQHAAARWVHALRTVFSGARVTMTETSWNAKHNQGTCLLPTKVRGYLVAVAA